MPPDSWDTRPRILTKGLHARSLGILVVSRGAYWSEGGRAVREIRESSSSRNRFATSLMLSMCSGTISCLKPSSLAFSASILCRSACDKWRLLAGIVPDNCLM